MREERILRAVEQLGWGTQRRYPARLRREIEAAAARLRSEGVSWADASARLGVSTETLRSWLSQSTALVPVEVAAETEVESIAVVLPNGLRLEGLDVEAAVAVVRALS